MNVVGVTLADGGLLGAVCTMGAAMLTLMRFWYGTIKERLDELRDDRDYWRSKVDPHYNDNDNA